jgi:hypothetical protein
MGIMSRLIVVALVIATAVYCRPGVGKDRSGDSGDDAGSAGAQPAGGQYSLQDFGRLRWIEGNWRGQLPDRTYFYERYHFLNDSTIAMHSFADSTFMRATDSAAVTLRGGTVTDAGTSAQWVATRLDSSGVDFTPVQARYGPFSWASESPNRWTATLRSADPAKPQTTVYRMERVGR